MPERYPESITRTHRYHTRVCWTGNTGTGTSGYRDYQRSFNVSAEGKPVIAGSSDPAFRGDRTRWNPEEFFVASISACHKLWYLHLCADAGIVVLEYVDDAEGLMEELPDGSGRFVEITLLPSVTVAHGTDVGRATSLHSEAHRSCFLANSVNFPVQCRPSFQVSPK